MNTTELYIEQVLIGSMVIATALLPWLPELVCSAKSLASFGEALVVGSAWVGVSFAIGVPYDRFSDTLTGRMERFSILFAALDALKRGDKADDDPFEADKYLVKVLQGGSEGLIERLDYHRSRVRISRAIGVIGPALTLAATVGTIRYFDPVARSNETIAVYCIITIVLVYLVWWFIVSRSSPLPRTNDKANFEAFRNDFEPSLSKNQTQIKPHAFQDGHARGEWWYWQLPRRSKLGRRQKTDPVWRSGFPWGHEWGGFVPAGLLLSASFIYAILYNCHSAVLISIFGIATSCIALGSFRRINQTYLELTRSASIEIAKAKPN